MGKHSVRISINGVIILNHILNFLSEVYFLFGLFILATDR